jgi:hypothetical protein
MKRRCNPAATDLITIARTLWGVQLKKSMPAIARECTRVDLQAQHFWYESIVNQ